MEITNDFFRLHNRSETLKRLYQSQFHGNVASAIVKLYKALGEAQNQYNAELHEIAKKYAEHDDKGNIITTPSSKNEGEVEYAVKSGCEEDHAKAMIALHLKKIDLKCNPISLSKLGEFKISPLDLANLQDFFVP